MNNQFELQGMNKQVFINEIKASFNLREPKAGKPTNIYLVIRLAGKQCKFSTGVKIYPEQWNKGKQEAYISHRLTELDNTNNSIVNDKIARLKADFTDFKLYLCNNPNEINDSLAILKRYIYKDAMNNQYINPIAWLNKTLLDDKTVKESTKQEYLRQLKLFKEFLESTNRSNITFSQINLALIMEYQNYLFNKVVGKEKGKTTKTSTVGGKIITLLAVIKRAEAYDLIDFHANKLNRYKKPIARDGEDNEIYLSISEIDRMYSLKLTGKEEVVRDLFVLQCWTGQRVSDIPDLSNGIIKETNDGKVYEIVQTKKTHKVTIPLFPISIEILEKYNYQLPIANEYTMLRYIRNVGRKVGITELCSVTEDRGGVTHTEYVEKFKLMGTHTARRSFISNMLKRGFDSHIIMKITGHKTEQAFKQYVKLTSEDAAKVMLSQEKAKESKNHKKSKTKQEVNINISKQEAPNTISNESVLDTLFAAKEVAKACDMIDQVGYIDNGKLHSYNDEITTIRNEVKDYLSKDKSELDVARQYIKTLFQSSYTSMGLYQDFQALAIGYYPKIDLDKDTILSFIERAEYIGVISEEVSERLSKMTEDIVDLRG